MDKVAFTIFGIDIMWYALIIASGLAVGIILSVKESRRIGFNEDTLFDLLLAVIITGIICARLYYVVFSPDEINSFYDVINIRSGGMAIHGGVFGGIIAGIIGCKIKKISFWQLADILMPSVILAQAIGRWGNFVNQEVYGGQTNLPWGISIDNMPGKYHPLFLYESLCNLITFVFLVWYRKNKRKNEGEVFALYLIFYGIVRFFLERMRVEEYILKFMSFSIAQIVSALIFISGIVIFYILRKHKNKSEDIN